MVRKTHFYLFISSHKTNSISFNFKGKGATLDVIAFLTEKYPLALQIADHSQMLPLHHAIVNNSPCSTIKYLVKTYPEALRCPDADFRLPFHLVSLHSNDMEVLQFLRANYYEEFQDLMVHPGKLGYQSDASSTPQKSRKRALGPLQNIKQNDDTLHSDLEKLKEEDDATETAVKIETPFVEVDKDKSFHVSLKAGNRMSQQNIKFDFTADDDSCASIDSVEEVQLIETERDSSLQIDASKSQEKERPHKERYNESLPKRQRIGTLRASTIASAFATLGKNTNNTKINQDLSLSESEEGKIPSYKNWSTYEIKAIASALRIFISTSVANECTIYNAISHTIKTKNPRQCYDFLRRIKIMHAGIK